jgi:hypothetical protein
LEDDVVVMGIPVATFGTEEDLTAFPAATAEKPVIPVDTVVALDIFTLPTGGN